MARIETPAKAAGAGASSRREFLQKSLPREFWRIPLRILNASCTTWELDHHDVAFVRWVFDHCCLRLRRWNSHFGAEDGLLCRTAASGEIVPF